MKWLRVNFVHTAADRLLDILVFDVPSDGNNFGLLALRNVDVFEFSADLSSGFVAVEEWHIAIHKNKRVSLGLTFMNSPLDNLHSFFSIICKLAPFLSILKSEYH